jgi:hypothetical protein
MDTGEKLLEEWKQRYESYRQLRNQYLMTGSIVLTACVIVSGITVSRPDARLAIKLSICFILGYFVIAHIVAMKTVNALRTRLRSLEDALGYEPYDTTWALRIALRCTLAGTATGLVIIVLSLF